MQIVQSDATTFAVYDGGVARFSIQLAAIPGGDLNSRLQNLKTLGNNALSVVTPLNTLSAQDPARKADPGLPWLHWDALGENLIQQNYELTGVTWDTDRGVFVPTFQSLMG